jgi:hypothetical protein
MICFPGAPQLLLSPLSHEGLNMVRLMRLPLKRIRERHELRHA